MGERTKIQWADDTFNPWLGCQKVSPACDHCYAEGWAKRSGLVEWGPKAERRRTSKANWKKPQKWNREAETWDRRRRVFCASLADVFDNAAPSEWRRNLWGLIRATPNLQWLLLTKRPQNIEAMLPPDWGDGWANIALGTTAENQTEADRRALALLDAPARWRFLSCEPLLGLPRLDRLCLLPPVPGSIRAGIHVDALTGRYCESGLPYHGEWDISGPAPTGPGRRIDWVIAGGESGPGARPMHPAWVRGLRDQCAVAGTPFFFKQWGEWLPDFEDPPEPFDDDPEQSRFATCVWDPDAGAWETTNGCWDDAEQWATATDYWQDEQPMTRVGVRRAGALLEGVAHLAVPDFGRPGDGRVAA